MIREIFSTTLRTFKMLKFRAGLNIILADKSEGASQRQTRNGAGKSSLLEIVHFLTSGDCAINKADRNKSCIFRLPELENHAFAMKMDLAGQPVIVNRTGAEHGTIVVDPGETSKWPIQPGGGNARVAPNPYAGRAADGPLSGCVVTIPGKRKLE
ncbi:MAG: hypothetical protein IIC01_09875 [Planctomycetes bacterium]|nr:hypothetical protein [Planctomycetota bacterium]